MVKNDIYISSSCVKASTISDAVCTLADEGFQNIELSGGTEYYPSLTKDLTELQKRYNLNFLLHNYFPPPEKHFVLNLASLDDAIFTASFEHCKRAIDLSAALGAGKFGIHGGIFFDHSVADLSKDIANVTRYDRAKSLDTFINAFKELEAYNKDITLYIENTYLSPDTITKYGSEIAMFLGYADYKELLTLFTFNILLDIGHLKVFCKNKGIDLKSEVEALISKTDYIHVSDNNGLIDQNFPLTEESDLYDILKGVDLKEKVFTLEVYDTIDAIKRTHSLLNEVIYVK